MYIFNTAHMTRPVQWRAVIIVDALLSSSEHIRVVQRERGKVLWCDWMPQQQRVDGRQCLLTILYHTQTQHTYRLYRQTHSFYTNSGVATEGGQRGEGGHFPLNFSLTKNFPFLAGKFRSKIQNLGWRSPILCECMGKIEELFSNHDRIRRKYAVFCRKIATSCPHWPSFLHLRRRRYCS